MTLLVASLLCSLAILLGGLVRIESSAATTKAQAQAAADASALAATAESAPYGGGDPRLVAEQYARANGARMLACDCEPGATTMHVRVAVGGVEAEARAVIDVNALAPVRVDFDGAGMDRRLLEAVETLVRASGGRVYVQAGYRSFEHQTELWNEAVRRYGDPEVADNWVARPGHSFHELGLAVDLGGDLGLAVRLIERLNLPLYRPLVHEPWHFELIGTRR
jgi:hypothetical protein